MNNPPGRKPTATQRIRGLREIADRYDAFLFDQWGVLHLGNGALPGALAALKYLRAENKQIAVLSNSGKTFSNNLSRLAEGGFAKRLFDVVLTSGDLALDYVAGRHATDKIYWLDSSFDSDAAERLTRGQRVSEPATADVIYFSGWHDASMAWRDYEPRLERAAKAGVPMICANRDTETFIEGANRTGPGEIARRYEAMGGSVRYFGKPDSALFDVCLARLRIQNRERVLVIGDTFATDICGAENAGLESLLVEAGVHREIFVAADHAEALAKVCGYRTYPRYSMTEIAP